MLQIAIVEDEDDVLRQLRDYILQYGRENQQEFQICTFHDGSEILENYSPHYDMILFDIEMPKMNGMEAAEAIRRMDEKVVKKAIAEGMSLQDAMEKYKTI